MVYTKGNTAANFLAALALISAFILGLFGNNYAWLLLSAAFVTAAWWARRYKRTGDTSPKATELILPLVICIALYFAGIFVSGLTG
jgi:hypothetical protein